VVVADKTFSKDSSLRSDGRQELVRTEEFQGKVEAATAARHAPLFPSSPRVRRGRADVNLIHSKQKTPDEIVAFVRAWNGRVPFVLVPTAYSQLSDEDVRNLRKVAVVIYGNHAIRAAVGAMRRVFAQIRTDGGIMNVDAMLPDVKDIIGLQGDAQMLRLEERFLR
jgi:2-methylisocitrate lyase-like PEP mutase family enzyme